MSLNEKLIGRLLLCAETIADGKQRIIEIFKREYGDDKKSTSIGWALQDLEAAMSLERNDELLFKRFMDASEKLHEEGISVLPFEEVRSGHIHKNPVPDSRIPTNRMYVGHPDNRKREYKRIEELGCGVGGTVYKVIYENDSFERSFALKDCDNIGIEKERFMKEIKLLSCLNHSGIVSIIDADFSENSAWYVMELIEGDTLDHCPGGIVEKHKLVSLVLEAVIYLHQNQITHRDLKPKNIMVRKNDGRPVLVDFGRSYQIDQTTRTIAGGGTPAYMSPESFRNVDAWRAKTSDIFSCGIIAYEVIAGHLPLPDDYQALNIEEKLDVSRALDRVIKKAIEPKVSQRYSSIAEMKHDWDAALHYSEASKLDLNIEDEE